MSTSITSYLLGAKTAIRDKSIDELVMGNEAADLDSMVSAIVLAYLRSKASPGKNIVPLMPIVKEDFKLRTEAIYVFETAGINPDHLIFLDEMPQAFMDRVSALALVDHNKLAGAFEAHADKVQVIVDHHKEENLYPDTETRIIEPVGSTATLVGEILIRDFQALIDPSLAMLLTGTILLDTVNLSPEAGRVTEKDIRIVSALKNECTLDQDPYFRAVKKAKFDTAGLTTTDLLRKDYKEFKFNDIRCGIASVPLSAETWTKKDNALFIGIETYARRRNLDVLLSMNAYTNPDFSRDLAVYCTNEETHHKLISFLRENGLELAPFVFKNQKPCREGKIAIYSQGNLSISRKKLSPILDEHFT
ncbi:MAG: DHH family phosphoesterase [Desulfobacterales bacterium]|nr:DHH family phosphoesterase [Desulfobacterales bacterium]